MKTYKTLTQLAVELPSNTLAQHEYRRFYVVGLILFKDGVNERSIAAVERRIHVHPDTMKRMLKAQGLTDEQRAQVIGYDHGRQGLDPDNSEF